MTSLSCGRSILGSQPVLVFSRYFSGTHGFGASRLCAIVSRVGAVRLLVLEFKGAVRARTDLEHV